ncbi:MAG: ATP-binding cassette domain-containing protein [Bryobacteraceae bacterium]
MVEFRGVSFRIGQKQILSDLSFHVAEGETVVLLGRSGSGKTTALRMVNALAKPDSGEVLVAGKSTAAWDPVRLKRSIGYVIQDAGLFPHFTVAQNIGLVPRLEGWTPETIEKRVNELLGLLDMDPREFRDRFPRQLSGGQRQRVGVARALAADPPVLLLDEPFGALDPVTRREVQGQFHDLAGRLGKTALLVTHDVHEAMLLGTRIGLMREGKLEIVAPPEEFRHSTGEEARAFLACLQ